MKIVHALSWYFPHHLGGTEVYVAELSQRLRKAGHDVLVAAPLAGAEAEQRYDHEGIPVYRYPTPRNPTRNECQARTGVRGAERFHRWLQRERPDWVHFHSFSTGLNVPEIKAARAAGARVLATNHLASLGFICQRGTLMRWGEYLCDGICEPIKCAECELQHRGLPKNLARITARVGNMLRIRGAPGKIGSALGMPELIRYNRDLQHKIFDLIEWFVVLNRWAADALVANGAPRDKVLLNYLGVSNLNCDAKLRIPRAAGAPVKVGYFGRIVELKGVVELAQAFALLPSDLNIELEFRGPLDGKEAQLLVAKLQEIVRHDERVIFSPSVPPAQAPQVLARFDVLCIPSIWFENGPTVMFEAHAVGTPVLGSRIGAMAEIISDRLNGRLVAPGNVTELAAALEEIVRRPTSTIDQWRTRLPVPRTMDDIALDYLRLYQS